LLARHRFYAGQMSLAMQAWEADNPARVLELLESQRPKFDQEDLRSFEWYHLWGRCHSACKLNLHVPYTHSWCVAFSPDGKTLASGYWNAQVKLWDVASGRERATLSGQHNAVGSVAFSPDGKYLVSGSFGPDENLKVWDVATGKELISLKPGQAQIRSLAFAPDGKTLATGGSNETVKLWDVATWQERLTLSGQSGWVCSVAFSPDSKTLASVAAGTIKLWDLAANPVRCRLQLPGDYAVAFAPDGKTLAAGSANGAPLRLWDVGTGRAIITRKTYSWTVSCVAFSPDGKTLAIGSDDRTVKVWEPVTGRERAFAHPDRVRAVAFAPDGQSLASAGEDGTVKLWDLGPTREPMTLQQKKGEVISALAFSPNGKTLATGVGDSTTLWDVATGQAAAAIKVSDATTESLAFSHDGETLAVSTGSAIKLIDVATHKERAVLQAPNPPVRSIAFSPDDKTMATGRCSDGVLGEDNSVKLWDLAAGRIRLSVDGQWAAFSPDGKTLATGGGVGNSHGNRWGTVTLWDPATGQMRLTCKTERDNVWGSSSYVQFSPDGALVAQATDYGSVLLWDVGTGVLRSSLKGHTAPIRCVAFHPDGRTLASASADGTVRLWDVLTGQERITLTEHTDAVLAVAFAPDGNTLAAASADGTVRLWRAATDQEAVARQTEDDPDDPNSLRAQKEAGDRLWSSGRPIEAEKAYRLAIGRLEKLSAASPNSPEDRRAVAVAYNALSSLLGATGRIPEAEQACQRARVVNEKLAADFPAVTLYRTDLFHSQRRLGDLLLGAGRYPDAESAYSQAIELNPDDPEAWCRRAFAYSAAGQPEKALADYEKAVTLIPASAEAHNNLAWFLATSSDGNLRDPRRALELAKKAVELAPQGNSWNTLGVAYYRAGEWKAAIEALNKSMDLSNGGDAFDFFFLAMAHWQQGDKDEAQKWHEKAVQWMQKNEEALKKDKMHDEELRRFRAEAEELLKVE